MSDSFGQQQSGPRERIPRYRTTGFRRTVKVIGALITILLIVVSTTRIAEYAVRQSRYIDMTVDVSAVSTIRLELTMGSLHLETSAANQSDHVQIYGHVTSGFIDTELDIETVNDELVIASSCPSELITQHCKTDLVLTVPEHVDVVLQARQVDVTLVEFASDFDFDITRSEVQGSGLSGDFKINGSMVAVDLDELRSQRAVVTSNFESVTLNFVEPPMNVRVRSRANRISVVVPADETTYDVRLSTDFASTKNNVRNDPDSDRIIDLHSTLDDVSVQYPS